MEPRALLLSGMFFVFASAIFAEETKHPFLIAGFSSGTVYKVEADGTVKTLAKNASSVQDVWPLADGKILYSFSRGARIIDPENGNKVVWEFVDKASNPLETHSCQPLPDGNVLLCQCGPARLIEVNPRGEIVKEIKLKTTITNTHLQFRMARRTKEGTYLVAYFKEGKAEELDTDGAKVLRTFSAKEKGFDTVHGCVRLANGNTLLTTGNGGGTFEFDKDGKIVWSFTKDDVPAAAKQGKNYCTYAAGVQRLPNGNTVISYYGGNPMFVEVTADRKIVWEYNNAELKNIAGQARLDVKADPSKFEMER